MAASSRPPLAGEDYVYVVKNFHDVFLGTNDQSYQRMFSDPGKFCIKRVEKQSDKDAAQELLESLMDKGKNA